MDYTTFVRKPFTVEAIQITEENIKELAKFIGKSRNHQDGTPYIYVDRRRVPGLERVYVGFWMTRMGDNIRCYSPKIFNAEFAQVNDDVQEWLDHFRGPMMEGGRHLSTSSVVASSDVEELPQPEPTPEPNVVRLNVLEREDYSNPDSVG